MPSEVDFTFSDCPRIAARYLAEGRASLSKSIPAQALLRGGACNARPTMASPQMKYRTCSRAIGGPRITGTPTAPQLSSRSPAPDQVLQTTRTQPRGRQQRCRVVHPLDRHVHKGEDSNNSWINSASSQAFATPPDCPKTPDTISFLGLGLQRQRSSGANIDFVNHASRQI
jgi:hypothetical protein